MIALALLAVPCLLRAQCTPQWLPSDGYPGTNGPVNATIMWDPDGAGPRSPLLVIAGGFTVVGNVRANNIAAYDPVAGQWAALGAGVDGEVAALTTRPNGELIAGGWFADAGGVPADNIASWNGSGWSPLGAGLGGVLLVNRVAALATMPNGDVVAGGLFATAGGAPANHIARWDGTSWSALGSGIGGLPPLVFMPVTSLAVAPNGDLIVGGGFGLAGGVPVGNIARWDGATWWPLGIGVGGFAPLASVGAVAVLANGDVVAGGFFSSAGGAPANFLARWDGASWSPFGAGMNSSVSAVHRLATGDLIVGGSFTTADGVRASRIARWDGANWFALGKGLSGTVRGIAMLPNGDLVAGGNFTAAGNGADNVARWNGAAWSGLAPGTNGIVTAMAELPNGDVIIGGQFSIGGGVLATRVVRKSGADWSPLGAGIGNAVLALAASPNGDVWAGGSFTSAGGVPANGIARWDGTAWLPLGTGLLTGPVVGGTVRALAVLPNGHVVAGGAFTSAGGTAANNIARWDGTSWTPLGAGVNFHVYALLVLPSGDLIAGGDPYTGPIARWNGTTWSSLGAGLSGTVRALAVLANGDLVAGGDFVGYSGGAPFFYLARWDGANWSPLGAGTNNHVFALTTLPNGDLVAGGRFTTAGGAAASRLARWDGATWSPLGAGVDGDVNVLLRRSSGDLTVGGNFLAAGGTVSPFLATYAPTCRAAVASFGAGCTGTGGPNLLVATSLPWTGSVFTSQAVGLPGNGLALGVLGLTTASIPLAALVPQGQPGCALLVSPDLLFLPTPGTGTCSLAMPNSTALAGSVLHQQVLALELDALGSLAALTSTNGLVLTIGTF